MHDNFELFFKNKTFEFYPRRKDYLKLHKNKNAFILNTKPFTQIRCLIRISAFFKVGMKKKCRLM